MDPQLFKQVPLWHRRILKAIQKDEKVLNEKRDEYIQNVAQVKLLHKRYREWYHNNFYVIESTLDNFPTNCSYEAIIDIFRDLRVPWDDVESRVILSHLDPLNIGFITSEMLMRLATNEHEENDSIDRKYSLNTRTSALKSQEVTVYLRAALTMVPGDPLSMELILDKNISIQQLNQIIMSMIELPTKKLIFKTDPLAVETLDESTTLGSLEFSDDKINLFYDYPLGYIDCPLVGFDSYFTWRTIDRMISF